MRIGILFHKNPWAEQSSIDVIRLAALSSALAELGAQVSIVAPVTDPGVLGPVAVEPLRALEEKGRFDVLKACYHFSLELLGPYAGPVVCRLVRVVDEREPERDADFRNRLLACQELAARRTVGLIFNNALNLRRWRSSYGNRQKLALVPTGCPEELPSKGFVPYAGTVPSIVFLGSLASPRMAEMLAQAASALRGEAVIHFIGLNKTGLYGESRLELPETIIEHGPLPEPEVWDYLRQAKLGLALAAGPKAFDNDLSKILSYLRAGLPVLAEERLANSVLLERLCFGEVFAYANSQDFAAKARLLLGRDFSRLKLGVQAFMARRHSWRQRARVLYGFLRKCLNSGTSRNYLPS